MTWIALPLGTAAFGVRPVVVLPLSKTSQTTLFVAPEDFSAGPIRPAVPLRGFTLPPTDDEQEEEGVEEPQPPASPASEAEAAKLRKMLPEPAPPAPQPKYQPTPSPVPTPEPPKPQPVPAPSPPVVEPKPEPTPLPQPVFEAPKPAPEPPKPSPVASKPDPSSAVSTPASTTPATGLVVKDGPIILLPLLAVAIGALSLRKRDMLLKENDLDFEKRQKERKKEIEQQTSLAVVRKTKA